MVVLRGFCEGFARVLRGFCEGFARVLRGFCDENISMCGGCGGCGGYEIVTFEVVCEMIDCDYELSFEWFTFNW